MASAGRLRLSPRWGLRWLSAAIALAVVLSTADAQAQIRGEVTGTQQGGFARLVFRLAEPVRANARVSGTGVLVLSFSEAVAVDGERLPTQVRDYVSVVRQDPDGRAMRFALKQSIRPNIMEAGERIFVDLLPSDWRGVLPGLPQDVVEELAQRARAAEAIIRDSQRRETVLEVPFRIGRLPTLTRVGFDLPERVQATLVQQDQRAALNFAGLVKVDVADLKRQLSDAVLDITAEQGPSGLDLYLDLRPGSSVRGFREETGFVLDIDGARAPIVPPAASRPAPAPVVLPAVAPQPAAEPAVPAPTPPTAPAAQASQAAAEDDAAAAAPLQAPVIPTPLRPPPDTGRSRPVPGPVVPLVAVRPEAATIEFAFDKATPAAVFQRGGDLLIVFDTREPMQPLRLDRLDDNGRALILSADMTADEDHVIYRLTPRPGLIPRLAGEGGTWLLSLATSPTAEVTALAVERSSDAEGQPVVTVQAPEAPRIVWIEDAVVGDKVAVVPLRASGAGVLRPHRFVEFVLLDTVQGVAVASSADDLAVRVQDGKVLIGRRQGLAVSREVKPQPAPQARPFIDTAEWTAARQGAVRDRWRALARAAADATPAYKPETRMALVRFLLANRLAPEARGVLDTIAKDNQHVVEDREHVLARSLVDIQLHRNRDAARRLSSSTFADDPEVLLWRAVAEQRLGRNQAAHGGFQSSAALLEAYPDDLQAEIMPLALRAAAEMRDFPAAERWAQAFGKLPPDLATRNDISLLRAIIDEGTGRPVHALEAYAWLRNELDRPIAAEAMIRGAELGMRLGRMSTEEAIATFETLSVIWRGDDKEIRALSQLGQLYGRAGQWRKAFQMARAANDLFPAHELTRRLHDETAALFEGLFLKGQGGTLDRVEALALYYDFKEFTPVGRRGDELIRHLADRLIDLDLIDQAADLLDYQVENRLSGAAKVSVATKLASLRLLGGQPQAALQVLQASRLPDIPRDIRRARLVLEAKALTDLGRTDLAIEMLDGVTGPDIDRLRADIYWSGGRWRDAGEAIERLLGNLATSAEALDGAAARQINRAAIAYVLADEALGLDRLRSRFGTRMAETPEGSVFAFLTTPGTSRTGQIRGLAGAANADALVDFFAEYRRLFPSVSTPAQPVRPGLPPAPGPAPAAPPGPAAGTPAAPAG